MNRLEQIREVVDNILMEQTNLEERRCGYYVHLYGVSSTCSLLALKRGVNIELCAISGMLHDISSYKTGDSTEHAKLGSIEARKILNEIKCFSQEEIDIICNSIFSHSNKQGIGNAYDEILKDADVLQHYLYNTNFLINENEKDRLDILLKELGINL
jgi:uncharacterized protein